MEVVVSGPGLGRGEECEVILRGLPEWFGIESAIVDYVRDIEVMPTFVAKKGEELVGFLTVKRHFEGSAEIQVMGVLPGWHRRGVGRMLVERAEEWLRGEGVEFFQVKTVSGSSADENYARTRAFYEAMGFGPLEEFPLLWDERNPCLLMVKGI